jgi:hypothetical protein
MHITRWKAVLVGVVALAVIVPAAAFAATSVFDDVADDSVYVDDINWLAASGVTKGCNPPTNDKFCPGSNVTREQMAAFMHRFATNKVVDAATALEADNADMLDGKDSTAFLGRTEKAADSDELDGMDSTAFLSAASLRPIAMALIEPESGFINVATGTGFAEVERLAAGIYCLTLDPGMGIDRADVMVNVSVEWGNSSGNDLAAYWHDASDASCGSDLIEIRTYSGATPTLTDNVGFVVTAFTGPYAPIPTS